MLRKVQKYNVALYIYLYKCIVLLYIFLLIFRWNDQDISLWDSPNKIIKQIVLAK